MNCICEIAMVEHATVDLFFIFIIITFYLVEKW